MAAVTICSDFGAQENKVCHVSVVSPSICHEVMGPDAMILVFWMLGFNPTFSLFLFPFHQEALQFLFASIWPLTFTGSEQFFPKCGIKITGWLLKKNLILRTDLLNHLKKGHVYFLYNLCFKNFLVTLWRHVSKCGGHLPWGQESRWASVLECPLAFPSPLPTSHPYFFQESSQRQDPAG